MKTPATEIALLLIDIQKGFNHSSHWGTKRSTPSFEANIESLLFAFRSAEAPIFHVCHHSIFLSSPLLPYQSGAEFMPCATPLPSEAVFAKETNSPFIETKLETIIRNHGIKRLVIAGLMTAHCVSSTVRMAANLNIVEHRYGTLYVDEEYRGRIIVVEDGTATFDVRYRGIMYDAETVHAIHLASLKDEFCDVERTEDVIERLQSCDTPS